MNIKPIFLFAFLVATLASCGGGDKSSEYPETESPIDQPVESVAVTSGKYQIKSGIIHFDVEGFGAKTKKVVYFDDYGAKERSETYNEDGSFKEASISDGKSRYTLIAKDKSAFYVDENGDRGWEMEFTPWSRIEQLRNYQEDYKKASNITVAGKDCESFVYGGSNTFAGWQGLTLYHKHNAGEMKASKLEENVAIPADKFTVPSDYTVANKK